MIMFICMIECKILTPMLENREPQLKGYLPIINSHFCEFWLNTGQAVYVYEFRFRHCAITHLGLSHFMHLFQDNFPVKADTWEEILFKQHDILTL